VFVSGWLTPKTSGNPGKLSEYSSRKMYDVDKSLEHKLNRVGGVALEQQYNI